MEGLNVLLQAAQFIEQQEKLQQSPTPMAPRIQRNANTYLLRYPGQAQAAGGHGGGAAAATMLQMSTSAPSGASGQFQHLNGLTITPSNGVTRGVGGPYPHHQRHNSTSQATTTGDFELSPKGVVTIVASSASAPSTVVATTTTGASGTFPSSSSTTANGRSSEGRLNANQLLQQQQQQQGQQPQQMIIDDGHMSYVTTTTPPTTSSSSSASSSSGSSNHSPPRGGSTNSNSSSGPSNGHQYMQMLNGGASVAGSGVSGRRRTISSNSTGAGTREVHNKLEKNRRAHLKECYKSLQQQLQLNDEDRKKTSNLSILMEAHRVVINLQNEIQHQEDEVDRLASIKMSKQRRIANLKRELGPKFEPLCAHLFKDTDMMVGNIPSEGVDAPDSSSPSSSGRGSALYSSTSSLASGASLSSPLGAGMQTAMPTAISPVINKTTSPSNGMTMTTTTSSGAPTQPTGAYKLQTTTGPHNGNGTASRTSNSPAGSPTATLYPTTNGAPLSLTAKNITAASLARGGSPTSPLPSPLTPSPSPSSSSDVSTASSSMLMMTAASPPMMINGGTGGGSGGGGGTRNVTVNIPNGLKFQTSGGVNVAGGATISAIGNGASATAAATIIATSPPGLGVTPSNNALQNYNNNNGSSTPSSMGKGPPQSMNGYINNNNNNITIINNNNNKTTPPKTTTPLRNNGVHVRPYDDGEQPTKLIKVLNGAVTAATGNNTNANTKQSVGYNNQQQQQQPPQQQLQKILVNGHGANELANGGRLPGGAELNILASSAVGRAANGPAFYHANGKLTLVNGQVRNGGMSLRDKVAGGGVAAPSSIGGVSPASGGGLHYAGNFAQFTVASTATSMASAAPKHGSAIMGASSGGAVKIIESPKNQKSLS